MLGHEISTWPDVSVRPMFGLQAFYREGEDFCGVAGYAGDRRGELGDF